MEPGIPRLLYGLESAIFKFDAATGSTEVSETIVGARFNNLNLPPIPGFFIKGCSNVPAACTCLANMLGKLQTWSLSERAFD